MHKGKKYKAAAKKANEKSFYSLPEAVKKLKEIGYAKFNETVEVSLNLGVDPKQSDQIVRGTVTMPHGTGKTVRILVFAKGEKELMREKLTDEIFGKQQAGGPVAGA